MAVRMGRVSALSAGLAAGLALAAAAPFPARADKASECLHVFTAPAMSTKGKPQIKCVDNDPSCDNDPTPGICRVDVDVCINQTDPTGVCAPRELTNYEVANVQPDSDPRHVFEFMTLQDLVNAMALPANPDDVDQCVGPVSMVLPLEVKVGKKGSKYGKFKEVVRSSVIGPDSARDDDVLPIQCVPAKGEDPCANVNSTLQELERHVFFPTCMRDTCHSGPQAEHTLTLLEGQSYLNLVGVMPDNLTARFAGKLRVDPGHPENSFILDKLRGTLAPNEGVRMPKDLDPIPARQIQLIEAWIAAGAPETGFVPGPGCQAP